MRSRLVASGGAALSFFASTVHASPVDVAQRDRISSCGDSWMAGDDVTIAGGGDERKGFNTAVDEFCAQANGQVVPAGGYLSLATEVFLNGGKDPKTYGLLGYVYFEVHNKQSSGDHTVETEACKGYLKNLSAAGQSCHGDTNGDTKGGTWQVGDDDISYHALPANVPPTQDALNKLWTDGAISKQSVNKGAGPPLDPMPLDTHSTVKPVACHSHNDYDRDVPLFQGLAAGCVSTEADVWLSGSDVFIGHIAPAQGRSLGKQYVDPLVAILDHNNDGGDGNAGIFKEKPDEGFTLLVDFKTSDAGTLDAVVAALEPLRSKNYLSYVENGQFVQRQITIVASGSAPFDRINSGDGVPHRDVFYDAHVDGLGDQAYTTLNSYYASADFQDATGDDWQATVQQQVTDAHNIGLKVRYYDLTSEDLWEQLMDLGVDRLNADDMSNTARLPRI